MDKDVIELKQCTTLYNFVMGVKFEVYANSTYTIGILDLD